MDGLQTLDLELQALLVIKPLSSMFLVLVNKKSRNSNYNRAIGLTAPFLGQNE